MSQFVLGFLRCRFCGIGWPVVRLFRSDAFSLRSEWSGSNVAEPTTWLRRRLHRPCGREFGEIRAFLLSALAPRSGRTTESGKPNRTTRTLVVLDIHTTRYRVARLESWGKSGPGKTSLTELIQLSRRERPREGGGVEGPPFQSYLWKNETRSQSRT